MASKLPKKRLVRESLPLAGYTGTEEDSITDCLKRRQRLLV